MPILPRADVVLRGGRIFVAYGEPVAEAIALWSGKVLAVGSSADMEPLIGPGTRIVELRGRLATPGLFEAHAHLLPMGISMAEIDARPQNANTLDALLGLIREAAAKKKPGEWILARGYDDSKLDIRRHPHRTELDQAAPDNPVYLVRTCGHLAVANTMALKIAGVTTKSAVPAGGAIEQVNGDLTGLMAENGRQPVQAVLPAYTDEDHVAAIERGAKYMNTFGITSTMDAAVGMRSGYREIISYRNAVRTGRQPIRVTQCLLDIPDGILGRCHEEGQITGSGDDMLRIGPVKIFTDGSAGGKTAAMTTPYSGEEQTHGIYCLTDKEMEEATMAVHAKGYQLAVHAIGDGAIEQTLVAMEKALAKYPDANRRHRIEHCGFNTMDQMKRMRAAGIEPVPQPVFIYDFGELYQQVMPDERPAASYPMKTWIDMGFRPAASTDAPVCDANVWPNFFTMITRKTHKGNVIGGDQVISIERAIQAYTEFGAYVNKCEDHRGTLRPGMVADVAVFSRDLLTASPEAILSDTRCDLTILGGACVHDATGEWKG